MCTVSVELVVVEDHELESPWVAARGDDGRRVLLVRRSCPPAEVGEGYAAVLRQCPVRMALYAVA